MIKNLILNGILNPLKEDASVLLRLILSNNQSLDNSIKTPSYCEFQYNNNKIIFQYDPNIYPIFRIFLNSTLIGIACIQTDGVGRIATLNNTKSEIVNYLKNLCTPCRCRAGHLLVVILRYQDTLKCECSASLLKSIYDSFNVTKICPVTFSYEITKNLLKEHALAVTIQRKRLSEQIYF